MLGKNLQAPVLYIFYVWKLVATEKNSNKTLYAIGELFNLPLTLNRVFVWDSIEKPYSSGLNQTLRLQFEAEVRHAAYKGARSRDW